MQKVSTYYTFVCQIYDYHFFDYHFFDYHFFDKKALLVFDKCLSLQAKRVVKI